MASVYNPLSNKDEVVNLKRILVDNESTYSRLSQELRDKCKRFEDRCKRLEYERNYYMGGHYESKESRGAYYHLFKKYVGLYNIKDRSLIIHHYTDNKSNYPYGGVEISDYFKIPSKVMGSWDNWTKEYDLQKKIVRNSAGIYEGIINYIILEETITIGNEYQYKFKDADGEWIEPVDMYDDSDDDSDNDTYYNSDEYIIKENNFSSLVNIKRDERGIWNAVFNARSYDENLAQ